MRPCSSVEKTCTKLCGIEMHIIFSVVTATVPNCVALKCISFCLWSLLLNNNMGVGSTLVEVEFKGAGREDRLKVPTLGYLVILV